MDASSLADVEYRRELTETRAKSQMPQSLRADRSSNFVRHDQSCHIHPPAENIVYCFGTARSSGIRCKNEARTSKPGFLPTCKFHEEHEIPMAFCEFVIPACGYQCRRLFEWKPHGYPLCPDHADSPRPCYILAVPMEIRQLIFRYLTPDQPVPAYEFSRNWRRPDSRQPCLAVMRACRLFHDEVAELLYARNTFMIGFGGHELGICGLCQSDPRPDSVRGYSSNGNFFTVTGLGLRCRGLNDYQLQLLLLEKQNRKRICTSRDAPTTERISQPIPDREPAPYPQPLNFDYIGKSYEVPIWRPPLAEKYFNMIQSFHIEIWFAGIRSYRSGSGLTTKLELEYEQMEKKIYGYCNHLHSLVERLSRHPRPIRDLYVTLKFGDAYDSTNEVALATMTLLRPLSRLRGIQNVRIASIDFASPLHGQDTNLISLLDTLDPTETPLKPFLDTWIQKLRSNDPASRPAAYLAYWSLERLVKEMRGSSGWFEFTQPQAESLLFRAMAAREAEDMTSLREVWDEVLTLWSDYCYGLSAVQAGINNTIDSIAHKFALHDNEQIAYPLGMNVTDTAALKEPSSSTRNGKRKLECQQEPAKEIFIGRDVEGTEYTLTDHGVKKRLRTPFNALIAARSAVGSN